MSMQEASSVAGGGDPISIGSAVYFVGMSVAAYLGRDFYENWQEVKAGFRDGWNNV